MSWVFVLPKKKKELGVIHSGEWNYFSGTLMQIEKDAPILSLFFIVQDFGDLLIWHVTNIDFLWNSDAHEAGTWSVFPVLHDKMDSNGAMRWDKVAK